MLAVLPNQQGLKRCTKCKDEKPLEDFYPCPTMKSGYRSACIPCSRADAKRFPKTPAQIKAGHLKHEYGLTVEDYARMHKDQNGLCAICGKVETVRNHSHVISALAVDHDHSTGKIRGLLCSNCNKFLGCAKDSEDNLLKAVEYLRKHKEN